MFNTNFYKGKKVLLTGHTGFKGAWMAKLLLELGADVTGYALQPPTSPSLFELLKLQAEMQSEIGDIRDYETLRKVFDRVKPDIVFHLAAQPIVRDSYKYPRYTYETNVMGTVNVLECIRQVDSVKSVVNVTTDKVYRNKEWIWGYRENEELNGFDPYSNSKSCSELITSSYVNSFFDTLGIAVSTARAGNVIGGGDFANDRIVPDCVRAAIAHEKIVVRNPYSTRPYQHVLEPVYAYLMIAAKQFEDNSYSGNYNVGPNDTDCYQTRELVEKFVSEWGESLEWICTSEDGPHEAKILKLDCSLMKITFGWHPLWSMGEAIEKTVEWAKCWRDGNDINDCVKNQMNQYLLKAEE